MTQPECPLPSRDLLADITATLPAHDLMPGYVMWIAVFAAVVVFEIWAIWTGNYTMSETVWYGPKWFKWALGLGFTWLLYHLFLER